VDDVPVLDGGRAVRSRSEVRDLGSQERRTRLGVVQDDDGEYRWRVDRVVPDDALGFLYGKFGSFKSTIALDMGQRVARGMPLLWGPHGPAEVEQGPVLYIAAEDYAGILLRRKPWEQYYELEPTPLLTFINQPVNLMDAREVRDLAEFVREEQFKFVVIDTLHRSMAGGSEVSDTDTAIVNAAAKVIQGSYYESPDDVPEDPRSAQAVWTRTDPDDPGPDWATDGEREEGFAIRSERFRHWPGAPTVLIVHHPNQRTNTLRGHGGFYGASDAIFRTTRVGDSSSVKLYCEKVKNALDKWTVQLQFVRVGDSGIIVPVEAEQKRGWNASQANHVRWHAGRGKTVPGCEFCTRSSGAIRS
jgi:hypothetical protein